jgi:hypothetical protein
VSRAVSPVPTGLVSKSVNRRTLFPAAFWILCMRQSQGADLQAVTDERDRSDPEERLS